MTAPYPRHTLSHISLIAIEEMWVRVGRGYGAGR